jgi:hypothetical protein
MSRRAYVPWPEKCAALICLHFGIDYEHAKQMDVSQVNSLVQYDHWPILKVHGGPDKFFNLTPRLILEHREKTKKDRKAIDKLKRSDKRRAADLITPTHEAVSDKPKRKMQSRGFQKPPPGHKRNWKTGRLEKVQ